MGFMSSGINAIQGRIDSLKNKYRNMDAQTRKVEGRLVLNDIKRLEAQLRRLQRRGNG